MMKTVLMAAVADDEVIAAFIAQRAGNLGADDYLQRMAEGQFRTRFRLQRLLAAIAEMHEVFIGGADHRITAVRIAQHQRKTPGHISPGADAVPALGRQRLRRAAQPEHRIEHHL